MSNNTINVEHTLIKHFSQVPRSKSLKNFISNIRGLGNKSNKLYCHLHHDLPHNPCLTLILLTWRILWAPNDASKWQIGFNSAFKRLSEDHLSESELQLIHLTNYSLGAKYCRKTFLKGDVSIFVYANFKYTNINIDDYNIDKYIEACGI
jgi:hypothetical protein